MKARRAVRAWRVTRDCRLILVLQGLPAVWGGRMKTALDRVALVTAVAIIVIFALMLGLMLLGWLPQ